MGRAFDAEDPQIVLAVRFVIAAQALGAIARTLGPTLPDTNTFRETKHYFMLLSLGLSNEAALAFEEARAAGVFDKAHPFTVAEINTRYDRLIVECDRNQPDSLRSRLVVFGRNKLAFHWDKTQIQGALKYLAPETLQAWACAEDEPSGALAIPIVEAVTITALGLRAGTPSELNEIMEKIARFQSDLFHVSHALYASILGRHK